MSLQVSLKLKLTKQIKTIKIKYNTFEKATFDEFLTASLALRAKSDDNAFQTTCTCYFIYVLKSIKS